MLARLTAALTRALLAPVSSCLSYSRPKLGELLNVSASLPRSCQSAFRTLVFYQYPIGTRKRNYMY
jgi:hypothetical protein